MRQQEEEKVEEDIYEEYDPNNYGNELPANYLNFINRSQSCTVLNQVEINGLQILKDKVYLYEIESSNDLPLFVRIVELIKQNNNLILLGKFIYCLRFYENLLCYEIEEKLDLIRVLPNQIKWYKPINLIKTINLNMLVPLNFYLPFNILGKYYNFIEFDERDKETFQILPTED